MDDVIFGIVITPFGGLLISDSIIYLPVIIKGERSINVDKMSQLLMQRFVSYLN